MSSFEVVARHHSDLDDDDLDHLRRLVRDWGTLSDLCFSDLLLLIPVAGSDAKQFVVLGQARPTTTQSFHLDVLVGKVIDEFERPMVARAWRRNEVVRTDDVVLGRGERARVECIPVRRNGRILAIMSRESLLTVNRRQGHFERMYLETYERFVTMVTDGVFPFNEEFADKSSPRIGDGSLILDADRKITFASPNAMNAMHRMGFLTSIIGSRLEELGISGSLVKTVFDTGRPISDELEPRMNVSFAVTCIPLIAEGKVEGALAMLRDVTDLRRLDRLLISKDATIREIHHRVKNNLQTISSLLDLQGRRLDPGPARMALDDAHRRVRSIALVHEILSRDANDQVPFNDIMEPLVRMAAQTAMVADQHVEFDVQGDAGELEAAVATPLAVVIAEVLANAVEHAFVEWPPPDEPQPKVSVTLHNDGRRLHVGVRDNGGGLPEDFSIQRTKSLGLSIVRSLVISQLQGTIDMRNDSKGKGTIVELSVPIKSAG